MDVSLFAEGRDRKSNYKHFNSHINQFHEKMSAYQAVSVNNHALDLDELEGSYKISRFVRDPRDLVVSGYFYHKRGAEKWCDILNPKESDWKVVNGCIPKAMGENDSFTSYLNKLSEEDGLVAEIEFRKHHFESMANWARDCESIKTFRYEDLIGNEIEVFERVFDFYQLSKQQKKRGLELVHKFSASQQIGKTKHIRDPQKSQWKSHFTPNVKAALERAHGSLLERYDYKW